MRTSVDFPAGEIEVTVSGKLNAPEPDVGIDYSYIGDVELDELYFSKPERRPGGKTIWRQVDILEGLPKEWKAHVLSNLQACLDEDELQEYILGVAGDE